MKRILGISAFYHDSAATVTEGGRIVAAAQEERFTRKKHDPSFPSNACRFCLEYAGFGLEELDAVVFYDKPLLKFERLLETYYGFAPLGVGSFITAMPVWLREKLFLKRIIREELAKIGSFDIHRLTLLFPEHHLSHAASAFYPSHFREAAILTVDGVGEWATATICHGKDNRISVLKELQFPHSLGLLYSAFTYFLGFRVNSGEYKLMGLAPYGNAGSERTRRYRELILSELIRVHEDGSLWMNPVYFRYATGLRMVDEKRWARLFGFPRRLPESDLTQEVCDLALAIQEVTTGIMIRMAREARRLSGSAHLCLAGGVALNCVANGRLLEEKIFDQLFIQPAAGDAGGSLGAALAAHYLWFGESRVEDDPAFSMDGACWGPEYGEREIKATLRKFRASCKQYANFDELAGETASLLAKGMVVGWFQGRMEFGPRALGHRSILGDPRNSDMQKKLNLKIKYRESFRPFAPAVLEEEASHWFCLEPPSPYMLLVAGVKEEIRNRVPDNYSELPLRERLYTPRSELQAITHVDFSARIQTVRRDTHPRFWSLISHFKDLTGCPVLVNTSFNVRGEPIVCTPTDAYRCFMRTEMDYLVINNCLFDKREQPPWPEDDPWQTDYVLD
ncbi:MAG TPA: carbamoyltransferase [Prolixibacteraceae bacterium]|jgi:carbamoyltransferase|nr:carbamoyltransferase [Prolixibacteraceae bacterium]